MTTEQWNGFLSFKEEFKKKCEIWNNTFKEVLIPLQKNASLKDTPTYPIENPVLYNTALDDFSENHEIRLIVIGDNPGKDEQLNKNQKYLVGQSGKIAQGFFERNPQLKIDFRKNTIILNKTPVHTAKTNHLKTILKENNLQINQLINESQLWMAQQTAILHQLLNADKKCQLWLVGYAELKEKGLFGLYKKELFNSYAKGQNPNWTQVKVFQHFSMNRFSIDLKNFIAKKKETSQFNLEKAIDELGNFHKLEIFKDLD